jgi:hypothetical protein
MDGVLVAVGVEGLLGSGSTQSVRLVDVANPSMPAVKGAFAPDDGQIESLALSGATLYVGMSDSGLYTVDVSDPWHPAKRHTTHIAGSGSAPIRELIVEDDFVALAAGARGVAIYSRDEDDLLEPEGRTAAPSEAVDVHTSDDLLYGLFQGDGLRVYDAYRPTTLEEIGHFEIDDCCPQAVFATGGHAYVGSSDSKSGIYVIDVSDPTEPALDSTVEAPVVGPQSLDVSAGFAYTTDGSALRVVDVRLPSKPVVVATMDLGAAALDYAAGYLYTASGSGGMLVIDVRQPAQPALLAAYPPPDDYHSVDTLRVVGTHAYLHVSNEDGRDGLRILDIRKPSEPREVGALDDLSESASDIWQLDVSDDKCFAAATDGSVVVIDVTDTGAPRILQRLRVAAPSSVRVNASRDLLYIASRAAGIRAFSLVGTRPLRMVRTWLDATGVAVGAGHAYVAAMAGFMPVVNVTDPRAPELASSGVSGSSAVSRSNDRLFASTYAAGFRVFELDEPSAPRESGHLESYWLPGDIRIVDGLAFVAAEDDGLRVLDTAGAEDPHEIGAMSVPGVAISVDVAGSFAYVGTLDSGMVVADVANPKRPEIVGAYSGVTDAWDVEVVGNVAYVAAAHDGFHILDVSAPTAPHLIGRLSDADGIGVDVVGRFAYLASPAGGLLVVDVSDPSSPELVAGYPIQGVAQAVTVIGSQAYVAALDTGLWLLRLDPRLSDATLFLPVAARDHEFQP